MNVPRFVRRLFRSPFDGMRHHGVVHEGVLYRCGQPTPAQLGELIERHSLRTVVSLRGSRDLHDRDAWEAAELEVCTARNAEFVSIPCNHKNPPTPEQIDSFLEITRNIERRPVLVHCRLGQQRTLLFCAVHSVFVQGVDLEQALDDMDAQGFGIRKRRHQLLLRAFHDYAEGRESVTAPNR